MIEDLKKAAEAIDRASSHLVESKKKNTSTKHQDALEEVELGLKWLTKKITQIIRDKSP